MREIRSQMGVPRFQAANGRHAPPLDGLAEALARRKELLGARLLDDTAAQVQAQAQLDARRLELDARKVELEEEQTETRLHEIRASRVAALREEQGQGPGLLGAVVQLLMEDRAAQREAAKEAMAAQQDLWKEMLSMARHPAAAATPVQSLAERVAEVKAVFDIAEQLRPAAPPHQAGLSAAEQLQLKEMDLRIEERRRELERQAQLDLRQLQGREQQQQGDLAVRHQQVEVERERNQQMARLLEQLGPAALSALNTRLNGDSQAPAGGGTPQQPEQPLAQYQCADCRGGFLVRPGSEAVICPHCHVYQNLRQPAQG